MKEFSFENDQKEDNLTCTWNISATGIFTHTLVYADIP